jgi:hypothetical protein
MNREISCALIDEELGKLRNLPYTELLNMMDKPSTIDVQGPNGKRYQIERQAFWDSKLVGANPLCSMQERGLKHD